MLTRELVVDSAVEVTVCLYATAGSLGDEVCWRAEAAQQAVAAAGNSDDVYLVPPGRRCCCRWLQRRGARGTGPGGQGGVQAGGAAGVAPGSGHGGGGRARPTACRKSGHGRRDNGRHGQLPGAHVPQPSAAAPTAAAGVPAAPPAGGGVCACGGGAGCAQGPACFCDPWPGAHACCGPGAQRVGTPSDDGGDEGDPCAGCLVPPLQCFLRHTLSLATPIVVVPLLALLKIAAGEVEPKAGVRRCEGGGEVTGEADGGFRQCAAAMADSWCRGFDDPSVEGLKDVVLPDGSDIGRLLAEQRDAGGRLPPPPPLPLLPSGVLPPPLALPPSRAGALLRLRMCGNPRCGNFAMEFEEALKLKFCKAVRYCGADCQRAHWREGHRAECKELAAGATGVTVAGL